MKDMKKGEEKRGKENKKQKSKILAALPKLGQHKGQTTIFIIVAIIIIALAILIYFLYPQISTGLGIEEETPERFIDKCINEDIVSSIEILSSQGGSMAPEHYIVYNGENIEYLCYTNEYYKTCVVQQPMLKSHIEKEIKSSIQRKAGECFTKLKDSYEGKGYSVNLKRGDVSVELLPKRVVASFDNTLSLVKGEESETHDKFRVVINNNLYELISIANSIIEWEARYGDSETTLYMTYYKDLKVEKKKQIEGSTIYIITDRGTGNKFQFASRSVVWPPGYGA